MDFFNFLSMLIVAFLVMGVIAIFMADKYDKERDKRIKRDMQIHNLQRAARAREQQAYTRGRNEERIRAQRSDNLFNRWASGELDPGKKVR